MYEKLGYNVGVLGLRGRWNGTLGVTSTSLQRFDGRKN